MIGDILVSPTTTPEKHLIADLGCPSSADQDFSHLQEIPYAGHPIGNRLAFKSAGAVEEEGLDSVLHRADTVVLQAVAHENGVFRCNPEAFGRDEIDVGIVLLETLLERQHEAVLVEELRQTVAVEDVFRSERPEIAVHAENVAGVAKTLHRRFDVPVARNACTFARKQSLETLELVCIDCTQTKSRCDVVGEVLGVVDVGGQADPQKLVVGVDAEIMAVVGTMPENVLESKHGVDGQRCNERQESVGLKQFVLHSDSSVR